MEIAGIVEAVLCQTSWSIKIRRAQASVDAIAPSGVAAHDPLTEL